MIRSICETASHDASFLDGPVGASGRQRGFWRCLTTLHIAKDPSAPLGVGGFRMVLLRLTTLFSPPRNARRSITRASVAGVPFLHGQSRRCVAGVCWARVSSCPAPFYLHRDGRRAQDPSRLAGTGRPTRNRPPPRMRGIATAGSGRGVPATKHPTRNFRALAGGSVA